MSHWVLVIWLCLGSEEFRVPLPTEEDCHAVASYIAHDNAKVNPNESREDRIYSYALAQCLPTTDSLGSPAQCWTMEWPERERKLLTRSLDTL